MTVLVKDCDFTRYDAEHNYRHELRPKHWGMVAKMSEVQREWLFQAMAAKTARYWEKR